MIDKVSLGSTNVTETHLFHVLAEILPSLFEYGLCGSVCLAVVDGKQVPGFQQKGECDCEESNRHLLHVGAL